MRLVQSVKVRLHLPLDPHTWEVVGPRLRELASISHRVLNLTMTGLNFAAERPDLVPSEHRSKSGNPSAYQMTADALERVNVERSKVRTCKWCAGAKIEPVAPPPKVKRSKRQPERAPGEPCSRCNGAGASALTIVDIPSAIQNGLQRLAERRHANDRADILRGDRALSTFRSPAPIPIKSGLQPTIGRLSSAGTAPLVRRAATDDRKAVECRRTVADRIGCLLQADHEGPGLMVRSMR